MSMTIEQAKKNIGAKVAYVPYAFAPEEIGTITEVRGSWIFVNYGHGDHSAKATSPAQLTLVIQAQTEIKKENDDG